jgi:glycosyltransferase involved in cell wall biosynthesis
VRILHVDTGREMRGGQYQALYLIRGLVKAGHACTLLVPAGSGLWRMASGEGMDARPLTLRSLWKLGRQADIVHTHTGRGHALAVVSGAPRLVVSRRVAFPVRRGWLSRRKYSRAAHYIAVSEYVKKMLLDADVAEEKVSVVYDGVPLLEPARLGVRVVAPATDDPRKGSALLREAAQRAGVEVHFSGDLVRDLAEAGLFVYITYEEGLGSAVLLAMAAAVPVVASRLGGLPEVIEHGVTGWLTGNSAEDIAAAIRSLIADREAAAALGQAGRRQVQERFTVEQMVEATLRVYGRVAA